MWFVIIQLKTKNGFLAVPDPSIFIKNGFLAVPDPSVFIKNGFLTVPDPSVFIKNGFLTVPDPSVFIKNGFLAAPDPSVFIKNGFLAAPVPCGVSKRSFWLVQHSFIDHSFAALNSPAPFDRLGGGLVDSFIYHMLSDDNSANLQHYFEKKEWMRDFFLSDEL